VVASDNPHHPYLVRLSGETFVQEAVESIRPVKLPTGWFRAAHKPLTLSGPRRYVKPDTVN